MKFTLAFRFAGVLIVASFLLLQSCATSSIALKPAAIVQYDVFTCKGLSAENRWIGVTDQFLPEKDSRVVVVAVLADKDINSFVNFELINPLDNVVISETMRHPKENPLGLYFEIPRLLKLGGEGEWKATVFADGMAIGEAEFRIGEKPKEDSDDTGPSYFVVGDESDSDEDAQKLQAASEEDRFSSYIREATPSLSIPLNSDSEPVEIKPESVLP